VQHRRYDLGRVAVMKMRAALLASLILLLALGATAADDYQTHRILAQAEPIQLTNADFPADSKWRGKIIRYRSVPLTFQTWEKGRSGYVRLGRGIDLIVGSDQPSAAACVAFQHDLHMESPEMSAMFVAVYYQNATYGVRADRPGGMCYMIDPRAIVGAKIDFHGWK